MPHKSKEALRAWKARTREHRLKLKREWHARYREKIAASAKIKYQKNRQVIRAREAARYAASPNLQKQRSARYYRENRQRVLAKVSARQSANRLQLRPKVNAYAAKRRALKKSVTVGDTRAIAAIYAKARASSRVRCYLCDKPIPRGKRHVDHVVSLHRGGEHSARNLAIACESCNTSKHTKALPDLGWLPFTGAKP